MRKVLIIFLFLTAFSLNAQGRLGTYYFIKDTKTGQRIERKDTIRTLKQRFGEPKSITYPNKDEYGGYDDFIYMDYEAFSLKVSPDTPNNIDNQIIVVIYITGKGIETYRGMKVGDRIEDVKLVLGDTKYTIHNFQDIPNRHSLWIDLPYSEGGQITEEAIACVFSDDGIIVGITVGAIDWN